MRSITAEHVAARIRKIRHERGWSLADVEVVSKGSIKAEVMGSYERCDRALSLKRTIEVANLFAVPLGYLLGIPEGSSATGAHPALMIDLRKTRNQLEQHHEDPMLISFTTFITWISSRRGDWNGEVLSLRSSDLSTLALMHFTTEEKFLSWLGERGLLITPTTEPNHP